MARILGDGREVAAVVKELFGDMTLAEWVEKCGDTKIKFSPEGKVWLEDK